MTATATASRLARLARPARPAASGEGERCELCGAALAAEHRHVVDVRARSLLCACRSCVVLLARSGAGGGHYRLVPERRLVIAGFRLDEPEWDALRLPVGLVFFFPSTAAGRVVAVYPSPVGATESLLELGAWEEIERANPVLRGLEPDVEALLVNRTRGARDHMVVPIDDCYALVGVVRSRWRGMGGGDEAWREIERFLAGLRERATVVTHEGEEAP